MEHSVRMPEIYGLYTHTVVYVDNMWEYVGQGQLSPHSIDKWQFTS